MHEMPFVVLKLVSAAQIVHSTESSFYREYYLSSNQIMVLHVMNNAMTRMFK